MKLKRSAPLSCSILSLLVIHGTSFAAELKIDANVATNDTERKILWYDARNIGVEGKAWEDTTSFFDRLPTRAEEIVRPPVWSLSRHSAGMCVRFVTDATTIHARWTLTSDNLAMPHMPRDQVSERVEPVVGILRAAHADTPILLVEDRTYADAFLVESRHQRNMASRMALRAAYQRMQVAGITRLHYLEGDGLLGPDGEDTVDGSHPTDLGFFRQADAFETALRPILGKDATQ